MKLRKLTLKDAERVTTLVSNKAVSKWTSNIPYPYTKDDAIAWIAQTEQSEDRNPYAITIEDTIVGCISYWRNSKGNIEVGYWVGQEYWGNGICTKAVGELFAIKTFPNVKQVVARIMDGNSASEKVLLNNHFVYKENCTIVKQGHALNGRYFIRKLIK